MISMTIFKSIFDNTTNKRMDFADFSQFESFLYKLSKLKKKDKKSANLISPAIYKPNSNRNNASVLEWGGWTALDIDDYQLKGNIEEDLFNKYGKWKYVCYSTARSSIEQPKFRLVFPLKESVESDKIKSFWYAINSELNDIGDKQCKDLSRMYYMPASYANAYNFIFSNHSGDEIDADYMMLKHPMQVIQKSGNFIERLPQDLQMRVIKYRQDSMERAKNIHWTSYRDCPFINRKLMNDFMTISHIDGSGRYALIYKIMSSVALNAVKQGYPITSNEIADLIKEFDQETSNRYQKRNLLLEADRAIFYAYKNV